MIVVVCDTHQDAKAAFYIFCSFCDRYEPFYIKLAEDFSLRCVTDDDLIYIFIDHHMKGVFDEDEVDFIEVDEFFQDMYYHYDADVFEDFHYGWYPW